MKKNLYKVKYVKSTPVGDVEHYEHVVAKNMSRVTEKHPKAISIELVEEDVEVMIEPYEKINS